MNLAATRFGDMMMALASLGTFTSLDTDIVILTSDGRGSIVSMVPTGTPRMRTWSPGYNPTADAKWPTILRLFPCDDSTYTPPTSTATSAMMVA